MRVLLLVTDLQPGGTPLRVLRWARWLPRIGIEPVVGCLAPRGPLSDRLDELGIANFACDARGRFDVLVLRRLAAALRRFDPDVLHASLFHANLAARIVGRLDRRRAVVTSTATIEIERRWHRWLESFSAAASDAHVVNSPAVARHVIDDLGFPASRVHVVPNGIDADESLPSTPSAVIPRRPPSSAPLIAWAGRMDPIKRLDRWVEVFARLCTETSVCGLLLGDGPETTRVRGDLQRRGLLANGGIEVGRVHMQGWVDRPSTLWDPGDLFLLTSDTEGSPNVLLEAMSRGCAVVASNVGGIGDLVRPGIDGELVRPAEVDEIVSTLRRLCSSKELRLDLGRAAADRIARTQGPSIVLERLVHVYGTVAR